MQRPGARRKRRFLRHPFRVAGRRSRSQRWSVGGKYRHKLCQQARELFATACPRGGASSSKWRTRSRERRAKGKKWSNLGKMLCARARQESDLETMKELINTIVQKT